MVTLNHPVKGSTNWYSSVDQNWTTIENSLNGVGTSKSVLSFGATLNGAPNSLCRWTDPGQNNLAVSGGVQACIVVPFNATLKNLYFTLSGAPGGTSSWIATVLINAVSSGITVTITGSASSGSDLTHSATVNAGDKVEVKITSSGTPGVPLAIADLECDVR